MKPLYTEDYYQADVYGGRGRGGSHGITEHCLFSMITQPYFRGFFVRQIHGSIRDSLWKDFLDRMEEVGQLNDINLRRQFHIRENEMEAVYIPNGNTVKAKGFKSSSLSITANMKSLAGATNIYGEEWEEVGEEDNVKMMDSIRTTKAPIKIIRSWNTPPKDHWLIKYFFDLQPAPVDGYYQLTPKGEPGHLAIYGTFKDNIKNLNSNAVAGYRKHKETFPKYYYNQIMGWASDGGDHKVYFGWKKVSHALYKSLDGFKCYGIDFGDTAPTAIVEVKYIDGQFYRHEVLYKSMRQILVEYADEIAEIRETIKSVDDNVEIWGKHKGVMTFMLRKLQIDENCLLFCDPAQKSIIVELREVGFNAVGAKKDKASNINFINRAVNYYTDESINLEAEYNSYYLETDVNKNPIDGKPKKGNDHLLEASEYAVAGIRDYIGINL